MNGLGIDLGTSDTALNDVGINVKNVSQKTYAPPKSSRRRAFVRQKNHHGQVTHTNTMQGLCASLPSMPLRENRSIMNKSVNVSPMCVMKHPLPPKPAVEWSAFDGVHSASATRRADTPSDSATPSPQPHIQLHRSQIMIPSVSLCETPPIQDSQAPPFLPAQYVSLPPAPPMAHSLPSKPMVPTYPPERDERIGIELFVENNLVVEGGSLHGSIQLSIPIHTDRSTAMLLAQPRVRLIGYECLPDEDIRHIFYRHMSVIDGDRSLDGPSEPYFLHGSTSFSKGEGGEDATLPCFASLPDKEGFSLGQEGHHVIPFSLSLPMGKGAKGSYESASSEVGYILIASVRVKAFGEKHSGIAHCFQKMQLYPYLNPTAELSSAPRPIICLANTPESEARNIRLAAALHRETWVAGQRVYFEAGVYNGGHHLLNIFRIALVRVETLYRAHDHIPGSKDIISCNSTIVTDETLAAGQLGSWWTGARPGKPVYFHHSLVLPEGIVTIEPGRHINVQYVLRVGVGAETSTLVEVDVPLRIIKYVSLDPPPPRRTWMGATGLMGQLLGDSGDQNVMVERVQSLETMRSLRSVPSTEMLSPNVNQRAVNSRTAQHKRSLDFINSAIRSATARHTSPFAAGEVSPTGLGIELSNSEQRNGLTSPASTHERPSLKTMLPFLEINDTRQDLQADVSLPLGDETVDDVELFFGDHGRKETEEESTCAQQSCQDGFDDSTLSGDHNELERSVSSSQLNCVSSAMPSTPTRESIIRGPASVPRAPRPKSSFTITTNVTPLKVRRSNTLLQG